MYQKNSTLTLSVVTLFLYLFLITGAALADTTDFMSFSFIDARQKFFDLSGTIQETDTILFFMDPNSDIDRSTLTQLNAVFEEYRDYWDIVAIGIGEFDKEEFYSFAGKNIDFHVTSLNDIQNIEKIPFKDEKGFFIVDRGERVTELSGGFSMENIFKLIAERTYQRGYFDVACMMYDDMLEQRPQNFHATSGLAYCNLAEGDIESAKSWFEKLEKPDYISSKLGFAYILLKEAHFDEATNMLAELEKNHDVTKYGLFYYLKAELVLHNNKDINAARLLLRKSVKANFEHQWIKAIVYNKLALGFVGSGLPRTGLKYFDKSIMENPYMLDALANKASVYWLNQQQKFAGKTYETIIRLLPDDIIARVFLAELDELENFKNSDNEKEQIRVEFATRQLAANYIRGEWNRSIRKFDPWTSEPMSVYYKGFENGGLVRTDLADGIGRLLYKGVTDSSRVDIVSQYKVNELVKRLGMSKDDVMKNANKLAAGFSSRLIMSGSVVDANSGLKVKAVIKNLNSEVVIDEEIFLNKDENIKTALTKLSEHISKKLVKLNPLQGKVVKVDEDVVIINLGSKHGLKVGSTMDVMRDVNPKVQGRNVTYQHDKIAEIVITEVLGNLSYGEVIFGVGYRIGDRLQESDL